MSNRTRQWLTLGLLGALAQMALPVQAEETIPSTWKVQEIKYSYVAFTTAYDCDSAAQKIKSILTELGAHPNTKVTTSGCNFNRPSRNFFVTIAAATPVPASEATPTSADQSKQALLKRLGVKTDLSTEQFPAEWKTVDLAKNRRLDLRPGDCELMEGLRDRVLPQLGMKVSGRNLSCTPNTVGIATPSLTVSSLVATKSADVKSSG
jgi:hypothetical protein